MVQKAKSFLILYLFILAIAASCSRMKDVSGLVYSINKPGDSKKTYIIGSMHYIPQKLFNKDDARAFYRYIDESRIFILEAEFDSYKELQRRFWKEYGLERNRDIMSDEELIYFKSFLRDSLNQSADTIEKILNSDPILTFRNLTFMYLNEPMFYMDPYLRSYAKSKNKEILYLDSPERYYYYISQYNLLSDKHPWFKNDSLKNVYFNELNLLFKEYTNGDFLHHNKYKMTSSLELINQRNSEWIPKIKKYIDNGYCTILVGKGHLDGILKLLIESGYEVTRE